MADNDDGQLPLANIPAIAPKGFRVVGWPYPHLRDDEGCILANDYVNDAKLRFILDAVREKIEREA